jgi:hypothetical protein
VTCPTTEETDVADDRPSPHEHDEDGTPVVSQNTNKNTVIRSVVFYCSCGVPVRTVTQTYPIDTGGPG